jgi:GMP synthase (glutamine-hydrolysing)
MTESILILDFGSQYTQLIARRVRELNVFCEILPYYKYNSTIHNLKGVILSGSPFSVRDTSAPKIDFSVFRNKVPILGICYGAQLMAQTFGGSVQASATREYGRAKLSAVNQQNLLFTAIDDHSQVWMSHGDTIVDLPENAERIAETHDVKNAAFCFKDELTFGIQFHPEVFHSTQGAVLLENFLKSICGCKQDWTPASFI